MKRLLLALSVLILLGAAVAWSDPKALRPEFDFPRGQRTPATHLRLNNDPADFQFAIVSDRTGGHRAGVFSRAVQQLNLLQPEFVVCVGDLIEGKTENAETMSQEWRQFQGYISQLQMPFFYLAGNHDISNLAMERRWKEKFGRRYYEFVYRGVLFLMLNSEDPPGKPGHISADQIAFIKRTLAKNQDCRWTLVFLHKPLWFYSDPEKNGWLEVEKALGERPFTVFAGHEHFYQKFIRKGRAYYQLATTGGDSKMRGLAYGEFDHIVWATMKKDGPLLANLLLDGVLPDNLKPIETGEDAFAILFRKPTHPLRCQVSYQGQPLAGAYVVFTAVPSKGAKELEPPRADGFSGANGNVPLSTYQAGDGIAAGEYNVTVVLRKPFLDDKGNPGKNLLPEAYSHPDSTPLRAVIKPGDNHLILDLK